MDFASVAAITVICYLVGVGAKSWNGIPDKMIPVIVGIVGGILGIVGLYTMADFPANDILTAVAVGISSGLASTGVNQAIKQLRKE